MAGIEASADFNRKSHQRPKGHVDVFDLGINHSGIRVDQLQICQKPDHALILALQIGDLLVLDSLHFHQLG